MIVAAKRGFSDFRFEELETETLLSQRQDSILLDALLTDRVNQWTPMSSRLRTRGNASVVLDDFSFLENPASTMVKLHELAAAEAGALTAQIHFADEQCRDIGAPLVLAAMRKDMAPIFTGGFIAPPVSKVYSALNLHRAMKISVQTPPDGGRDVWAFPLAQRRPAGSSKSPSFQLEPQSKEKLGDDLCRAVDVWLSKSASQKLTLSGRRLVKGVVGETLDNAERHSRPEHENDGDWLVSGFLARRYSNGKEILRSHLAFLSIGSPIAETILGCDEQTKKRMETYVNRHLTGLGSYRHADEHLRTVFALQDFVSGDKEAFLDGRGGTGFADILHFFCDLSGAHKAMGDARLSVVSGRTCLLIDYPYCSNIFLDEDAPRHIWLNEANSEHDKPDVQKVTELPYELRGTLLTMAFNLEREYLENTANGQG